MKFKPYVSIILFIILSMVLVISAEAATGTVIEAEYTEETPDMNPDIIGEGWGESLIHLDKNSPNSELHEYVVSHTMIGTKHPEDGLDIYARWDDKYFYLCLVSPDDDPGYDISYYLGDGAMLVMLPGEDVHYAEGSEYSAFTYAWSLGAAPGTLSYYGAAEIFEPTVSIKNGLYIAKLRVTLKYLGFKAGEDLDGCELAVRLVRLSGRKSEPPISGWLAWGKFYEHDLVPGDPDTLAESANTIRLVKHIPEAEVKEEPQTNETEAIFPEGSEKPSSWAMDEVVSGIKAGLVPDSLKGGYASPVTRGAVCEMFVRLLENAMGKTVDEILEERGLETAEGTFTDTDDRYVLSANALGIIKGTGNGKFSPDNNLTRAQIAAIINRVAKVCGIKTDGYSHSFTDITDNYSWVDGELGWCVHSGIIKGTGEKTFSPGGTLTTEQAILITVRSLDALR